MSTAHEIHSRGPSGSRLSHIRVGDVMHPGIFAADPALPLTAVARIMSEHRVHAVLVNGPLPGGAPWGMICALDVASAASRGENPSAGEVAATEAVAISANERVDHAAQVMVEHEISHLVVLDAADGHPVGILSTLDVAVAYAG